MTAVSDEEDAPDSQTLLELPPQRGDRPDGVLAGDPMDDAPWLEDVSWTDNSTPDPTLVSACGTDADPEHFEDLLDPDLFDLEAATSSGSSQDIDMPQSDCEDEHDLPSLESLLHRNPTHANPKPHDTPAHEKPTESTLQIQGWVEVQGPDGTPVLQELPDHEPDTPAPRTGDTREGQSRGNGISST